ncbi:MAG: radical SAM protein [Bdellovibrionaceae bacterium]|nr:radical SAM protein [Pseudobdellovibrionaceae bacterium]
MSGTEKTVGSDSLNFRQNTLDKISASFCGAKWYESTIWLNSGLTASCHHTPAHKISREEIATNPAALHNTKHKMSMRRLMQKGIRPEECEYCWKLEDMSPSAISDRVLKTQRLSQKEIQSAKANPWDAPVAPRFLEIAFDRICQFACMYCSPSYSTTWERDIAINGVYKNLSTDYEEHYISGHESVKLDDRGAEYAEAFWRWWPELVQNLETLRVTGGEPLLSPHFWSLIGRDDLRSKKIKLAINSNLGVESGKVEELLQKLQGCVPVEIYTSGEAFGVVGEYIRDGKNWNVWTQNIELAASSAIVKTVCVSFSINALSVLSLIPMLDYILELRSRYGAKKIKFFWNIVRYPRFQSLSVLPLSIRRETSEKIALWLTKNTSLLLDFERHSVERFLQYIALEEGPTAQTENKLALQKDLKNFVVQYDQRRKKKYAQVLPASLVEWLDSIELS